MQSIQHDMQYAYIQNKKPLIFLQCFMSKVLNKKICQHPGHIKSNHLEERCWKLFKLIQRKLLRKTVS